MSQLLRALGEGAIAIRERVSSRTEAISIAGNLLVESGRVGQPYVSEMLAAVEEHGPYIVIAPGIALAHGKPSQHVIETGMSLLVLKDAIRFEHELHDPVHLVFGLAAEDHTSHIDLMASFADKLSNRELVNSLASSMDVFTIRSLFS